MIINNGWLINKESDGSVLITKDGIGGCYLLEKPRKPDEHHSAILWQLVTDLLDGKVMNDKA